MIEPAVARTMTAQLADEGDSVAGPEARLPHDWIEQRCRLHPDRIAIECGSERISYGELDRRANVIAAELRRRGVRADSLVAVCMDRSPDLMAALLGILKAGGGFVPLDPDHPPARLQTTLSASRAELLLSDQSARENLAGYADRGAFVHLPRLERRSPGAVRVTASLRPDNVAFVVFTSGTTGNPKGIQITHGSFGNILESMLEQPGMESGGVVAAVSTISFDMGILEVFLPLVAGARLLLLDKEVLYDPSRFSAALRGAGVTQVHATPSLLRHLRPSGDAGFPALTVVSAGEALERPLAQRLLPVVGSLWNMYGPTEATVYCGGGRITNVDEPITLGAPVKRSSLGLFTPLWTRPGPGEQAEIVIGGAGLARGYLRAPALTAERFVPDPWGSSPGARLYRTGDAARALPDGRLQFVGRLDRQVKVRGVRIELAEVEEAIAALPGVRQCAAAVKQDAAGQAVLVAYVAAGPDFSSWNMRKQLRPSLPDAMIPGDVVVLEQLPLSANGKVDHRALADARSIEGENVRPKDEPRSPRASQAALLWARELKREAVGLEDRFFDLGGTSMQAVQVMQRMKRELGIAVSFQDMLFRTLGQMLALAGEGK